MIGCPKVLGFCVFSFHFINKPRPESKGRGDAGVPCCSREMFIMYQASWTMRIPI